MLFMVYINFDFNYMYSKISGKHSKKYYNVSNIGNKQFFRYFDFLTVVFHELTHARFTYLAYDNRKDYPILHSCFENLVLSNSIYQEHHDLLLENQKRKNDYRRLLLPPTKYIVLDEAHNLEEKGKICNSIIELLKEQFSENEFLKLKDCINVFVLNCSYKGDKVNGKRFCRLKKRIKSNAN